VLSNKDWGIVAFQFSFNKCVQLPIASGELADGAQETPPALPFRYPGNLVRERVSYFGQRLPIPMREDFGLVTHAHPAIGQL